MEVVLSVVTQSILDLQQFLQILPQPQEVHQTLIAKNELPEVMHAKNVILAFTTIPHFKSAWLSILYAKLGTIRTSAYPVIADTFLL
jgi:hypothetical protein